MVLESPSDAAVQAAVDRSHAALRASLRPFDHRSKQFNGGHYRAALVTGLTTVLAAGDRLFSLRWTDPDRLFVLKKLTVANSVQTAYTTAQENAVDLVKLTGFTAADGGGTATVLGSAFKQRAEMANSQIADLRVASATAVTAGTSVVDGIQGRVALNLGNTLGNAAEGVLYDHQAGADHPLVLGALEGLNCRVGVTQGAVGVIRMVFTLEWAEVPIELLASV